MSKKIKHRRRRSAERENASGNSAARSRKRRQRLRRLPLSASTADLAFELPWSDQVQLQVGARHQAFKTDAQDVDALQLVAYDVGAPVNSLNYLVLLPHWPRRGAEALLSIGLLEDAATYGISVKLNLDRGWQEDIAFLINSLSTIVGPELQAMCANAQITRLRTINDITGLRINPLES